MNMYIGVQNFSMPAVKDTAIQTKSTIPVHSVDTFEKTKGMDRPTKMLLSLVKSALNDEPAQLGVFKRSSYSDWLKLLEMANDSSLTGIALDASKNMPKGVIPKSIEMKMSQVQRESEARHAQQEKVLGELSNIFDKKGIDVIQMKGIGFSMNYPNPRHRFGGDIDVFTRLKGTKTSDTSNAYHIVDGAMASHGYEVEHLNTSKCKHSEFYYKGVRIENHRYFINKEVMPEARELDKVLHKTLNPQPQILPNGTKILVPSKEFNSVFIAHHAFQHYAFSGIDLHHLTDWSVHLKKNGLCLPDEVKGTKFEQFVYALTNLSNKYLGTKVEVPENDEIKALEDRVFAKMLHPEVPPAPKGMNKLEILMYKTKGFLGRTKHSKEYTGVGFMTALFNGVWRKLKEPSTIFRI
jgi:hypothetical protein